MRLRHLGSSSTASDHPASLPPPASCWPESSTGKESRSPMSTFLKPSSTGGAASPPIVRTVGQSCTVGHETNAPAAKDRETGRTTAPRFGGALHRRSAGLLPRHRSSRRGDDD